MQPVRTTVTGIAAVALLLAACGDPDEDAAPTPDDVEEPVEEPEEQVDPEDQPEDDPEPAPEPEGDEEPDATDPEEPTSDDDAATGGPDDEAPEDEATDDGTGTTDNPTPDATRLDDPCEVHEDGEPRSFIDVVSPVDGQVVSDQVDLVGCANVFEATVEWRLLDDDGELLDEGFTTADCSITCNGVFDDEVPLDAASDASSVTLEVFSRNADDEGPEQLELTSIELTIG